MSHASPARFPQNAQAALADQALQTVLHQIPKRFIGKRAEARRTFPEFGAIQDATQER